MGIEYNSNGLRIELHGKPRCKHLQILSHEFGKFYDLMRNMLETDPSSAHETMQAVVGSFAATAFNFCEDTLDAIDNGEMDDDDEGEDANVVARLLDDVDDDDDDDDEMVIEFTPAFGFEDEEPEEDSDGDPDEEPDEEPDDTKKSRRGKS